LRRLCANAARQGEEMKMARVLSAAMSVLLTSAAPVLAQEPASVDAGYALAQAVCAECHGIEAEDPISPNINAPPFHEVANKPGMTIIALSVWLRTPHPTMPNLVISADEVSDLSAYILSLKSR
jgi:mono/diheme cytochrome c family protein